MKPSCGDKVCGGRCDTCLGRENFWDVIDAQLDEVEKARSYSQVKEIVGSTFYGSGGDRQLGDALRVAGWRRVHMPNEWTHHYRVVSPTGDVMEYCEGDICLVGRVKKGES